MFWSYISSLFTSSSSDLGSSSSCAKNGIYEIDDHQDLQCLLDKNVTLVKFRHFRALATNRVVMHHFMLLDVRPPGPHITSNTSIKLEKRYLRAGEKPGIEGSGPLGSVTVKLFPEYRLDDEPHLEKVHEVILPPCCQEILMQKLLDLLTKERTLSYSVWRNNCWKYVYDCQKAILEACAARLGNCSVCKKSVDEARKNLPKPSLLSDVFHWSKLLSSAIFGFGGAAAIRVFCVFAWLMQTAFGRVIAAGVRVRGLAGTPLFESLRVAMGTVSSPLLPIPGWNALAPYAFYIILALVLWWFARCIIDNTPLW